MFTFFQITVYLGKRDFVDHLTHVDPIGEFLVCVLIRMKENVAKNKNQQENNGTQFENVPSQNFGESEPQ